MRTQTIGKSKGESILIDFSREKLIHSIIYFLENTKYCFKTKLFKLLYLLDFVHFKQTASPVTGLDYFAWEKGPVPKKLFEEFVDPKPDLSNCVYIPKTKDSDGIFRMKPKCKFDPHFFSKRELKLMEQIAYIFKNAKADDMIEVTHLPNEPWDKTIKNKGEYEKIEYVLSIDNTKQSLSLSEAKERLNEIREIESVFRK
jgi:uncharacterized phage-associated protein